MINDQHPILLNVRYIRPSKNRGVEESFEVIYVDDSGNVKVSNEAAMAEIWFVKPELRNFNYHKPQEKMENMFSKRVPISQIKYEIAKEIGSDGENFLQTCFRNKDYGSLKKLFAWRFCFGCDFLPEFYFMKDWYSRYKLPNVKLKKAYIDIETDLIDYVPDLDNLDSSTHAPVNCVSVILDYTQESFTFILKPGKPPALSYTDEEYKKRYELYEKQLKQYEYLIKNKTAFIDDLHKSFDSTYGELKYHIRTYENEIDLIADVFRLIHDRKPYFCMAWNMRFDLQYLYYRIKTLGYDPLSIMCHPDFRNPSCYFKIDRRMFQISKQQDFFSVSSYTQYLCQMRLYSNVRKSGHALKSVSLNSISDIELGDKKVEYPEETDIMHFPYVDFQRFVKYNIKDVLLQYGIENKVHDLETYYFRSHANWTVYSKIFRETHLLRYVREQYFNSIGWVQSNNLNAIDFSDEDKFYSVEDETESESTFKGAIMADPKWNSKNGLAILGTPSNFIFANAIDFDMSSFYPSNKIASNMDPDTMIFKAYLDNKQFISGEFSNRSLNITYTEKDKNGKIRELDHTGQLVHTYAGRNYLTFGYNYLNLPDIATLYKIVQKELK